MQALAQTTEDDCYTRAANDDCFYGGPGTRTKYGYDVNGLPSTLTYPTSTSGVALNIQYTNQNGLLLSIEDTTDATSVCGSSCTLWLATGSDAWGHVTAETLGNGVKTLRTFDGVTSWLTSALAGPGGGTGLLNQSYLPDMVGNITQRQNNTLGLTENFWYDADNRVTCASLTTTCSGSSYTQFSYDNGSAGPGNITSQTGVGSYSYPTPGGVRPHAVSSITGTFNGVTNPGFSYDANGNMTARASTSANVAWSSYNYPTSISGNDLGGTGTIALTYGPDRQRLSQTYTLNGSTETTYYIGGSLELVGTNIEDYRHYIYAGSEPIAVYSRKSTLTTPTMTYFLEDHLGGVANLVNSAGTSIINESFTAFGQRRNPTTWSGVPASSDLTTIALYSRQGFTFQTALGQSMGLNHMNGRVQDAISGRFISADPNIPDPTNAQSYNRYTYVLNNPLHLVDPTGFCDSDTDTTTDPDPSDTGDSGDGSGGGDGGDDGGGGGDGGDGGDVMNVHRFAGDPSTQCVAPPSVVASWDQPSPDGSGLGQLGLGGLGGASTGCSPGDLTCLSASGCAIGDFSCSYASQNTLGPSSQSLANAGFQVPASGVWDGPIQSAGFFGLDQLAGMGIGWGLNKLGCTDGCQLGVMLLSGPLGAEEEMAAAEGAAWTAPSTLVRVIPGGIPATTLGAPGALDVFVTTPEAIEGLDAAGIAQRLTIPESPSGFQVIQFSTPESGLASPVFRTNPGFVQGGFSAGGAPEFVIPNGPIPPGATITTVP